MSHLRNDLFNPTTTINFDRMIASLENSFASNEELRARFREVKQMLLQVNSLAEKESLLLLQLKHMHEENLKEINEPTQLRFEMNALRQYPKFGPVFSSHFSDTPSGHARNVNKGTIAITAKIMDAMKKDPVAIFELIRKKLNSLEKGVKKKF